MTKPISSKRVKILLDNFNEYSFEGHIPDKSIFDRIDNPAELHFIAKNYNWDDGILVLNWIINNAICDKATAKFIFWTAAPDYYTQFEKASDNEYDDGVFGLLKTIIKNFENGFYIKEEFSFNPNNYGDVDYLNPKAKWVIPKFLKTPAIGQDIEYKEGLISMISRRIKLLFRIFSN